MSNNYLKAARVLKAAAEEGKEAECFCEGNGFSTNTLIDSVDIELLPFRLRIESSKFNLDFNYEQIEVGANECGWSLYFHGNIDVVIDI